MTGDQFKDEVNILVIGFGVAEGSRVFKSKEEALKETWIDERRVFEVVLKEDYDRLKTEFLKTKRQLNLKLST